MQDGCTLFYQSKQTSRNLLGVSTQKVVYAVLCRDSVELHFSLSQAAAREFAYEALPFGRSTRRRFQSFETKIQEFALHDVMRCKYSMDHQWSASQVSDAWLGIHGFQSVWVWLTKKCLANVCKPKNTSNRFMSYDSYGSRIIIIIVDGQCIFRIPSQAVVTRDGRSPSQSDRSIGCPFNHHRRWSGGWKGKLEVKATQFSSKRVIWSCLVLFPKHFEMIWDFGWR